MSPLTALDVMELGPSDCNITLAKPTCELRYVWIKGVKTLQQAWRIERYRVGEPTLLETEWRAIKEVT